MKRVALALCVALMAVFGVVGVVAAQDPIEPVTVTLPAFDTTAIITVAMGIAGSVLILLVTMAAFRAAPAIVRAFRKLFGASVPG